MKPLRRDDKQSSSAGWFYLCCALFLSNFLVYQLATSASVVTTSDAKTLQSPLSMYQGFATTSTTSASTPEEVLRNPLSIPRGQAKALPSIRDDTTAKEDMKRSFYGGAGDQKHLGGFTDLDVEGITPRGWKWMVQRLNIQSVLDVGCGRGISTSWFLFHGLSVLCVEGSHDARERTVLPNPDKQMVEHDFSRGPWWPGRTFDAVWCVEFLEHVSFEFLLDGITEMYWVDGYPHETFGAHEHIHNRRLVGTFSRTTFLPSERQVLFL